MRALFLAILLCIAPCTGWGAEILVLQSGRTHAYGEALRGFNHASKAGQQALVLSDYAEIDVVRVVREQRPRLVLAVGDRALAAARRVRDVPVVAVLALTLDLDRQPPQNVGGVSLTAAPQEYLRLFRELGAKRVAVPYDPDRTGRYLKRALQEAREQGLTLVAEQVKKPRDLQAKLEKMKEGVDALWVLPDSTVATTVNVEALLLFSMGRNLPAVTFTGHYLKSGAAAALEVSPFEMGVQAGELATSLLNGGVVRRVPVLDPRRVQVKSNDSVLRKLGKGID